MSTSYTLKDLGYSKTLTKNSFFSPLDELYSEIPTSLRNVTYGVTATIIRSGSLTGNMNIIGGYLKSDNYYAGTNGWKFDALGNLEANSAVIRGSLYADAGLIGGWVIDDDGLYYNGSGTPNIRTSEAVESGDDGVILDKDGIRGYSSTLGEVFNLPSDGSAPTFSSGTINETIFEISTNAVLRTSSTVGDGSANSEGVLINNSGIFVCESYQNVGDANVRISYDGNAYFSGTVNSSQILSSDIYSTNIYGAVITGANIRTSETGQRTEINVQGIQLYNGSTAAYYGDMSTTDYQYGSAVRTYGTGVLGYINNSTYKVPFYVQSTQDVGDIHLPNRSDDPTGAAEIGDLCVVDKKLKICVLGGTPGHWEEVGIQTGSRSPSTSPSVSPSISPSVSPSPS